MTQLSLSKFTTLYFSFMTPWEGGRGEPNMAQNSPKWSNNWPKQVFYPDPCVCISFTCKKFYCSSTEFQLLTLCNWNQCWMNVSRKMGMGEHCHLFLFDQSAVDQKRMQRIRKLTFVKGFSFIISSEETLRSHATHSITGWVQNWILYITSPQANTTLIM